MITTLIIVACVIGIGVYWLRQQKQQAEASAPAKPTRKAVVNDFASVEIKCAKTACKTARDLLGKPLLAVEAPVLPLANCDAAVCNCSYHKIDDRRQETGRRTIDHGIEPLIFDGNEQRARAPDRRAS